MKKKLNFVIILFVAILVSQCKNHENYKFMGMWQSLNESSLIIEFKDDNKIDLYRNGEPFWSMASVTGELKYEIREKEKGWYDISIIDRDEVFVHGKIEIINEDRIRIYFFKHHDILDAADEYYRTSDFDSFGKIMDKIDKES
ncbi:MAG: hypothetical protein JXB49_19325 [Bacteroidales bacterium]|nr:hypothetical protein [Bacteroidales bacterium]